jgi:hypothetical protein
MSGQSADGAPIDLPVVIDDAETIVRAVVSPAHYKKGKVKTAAFRPQYGKSSISVMRQLMGDDFCKDKAVEIGKASPNQTYVGLLTIKAAAIREAGSSVTDSREEWPGHADLDHGFPSVREQEPGEPEPAAEFARMTERCQALRDASLFHEDENPDVTGWAGSPLKIE